MAAPTVPARRQKKGLAIGATLVALGLIAGWYGWYQRFVGRTFTSSGLFWQLAAAALLVTLGVIIILVSWRVALSNQEESD